MRFQSIFSMGTAIVLLAASCTSAWAHSALLNCYDNADGTFTCQGGYSDGSSATGIRIVVRDSSGTILQEARLDSNSEVVLQRPQGDFTVLFDGGSGHSVEVDGRSLVQ